MKYVELPYETNRAKGAGAVALVPLAATEQHGSHLPVGTDAMIGEEIARRVEEALPEQVLLLPPLWVGCSHHHVSIGGTASASSESYIRLVGDLADSLEKSGCRRIFFLNSHGGNELPASEALYRRNIAREGDDQTWVTFGSYWRIAEREIAAQDFMETARLTHACEYETSMIMALRPDLVDAAMARGPVSEDFSSYYHPLSEEPFRVYVAETFAERTASGAMGKPEFATAEKGERLFTLLSGAVTAFVREFLEWPDRATRQPARTAP